MVKQKMKSRGKSKGPTHAVSGTANVTSSIQNHRGLKRPLPSPIPSTSAHVGTTRPRWCQSNISTQARLPAKKYKGNSHNLSRGWKPFSLRYLTHTPPPEAPKVQKQSDQNQRVPPQFVSEKDITSCQQLYYGAYIGNETRTIEFKKGAGRYIKDMFHKDVCKYGCAFLNSGGGSLLIGVCNNGMVRGVHFSHTLEDMVSLQVDFIVNNFDPPLLPQNYSLQFLPVIKPEEKEHNLKVLCLTFKAPLAFTEPTLFQIDQGKVYIRRDGSVHGPLRSSVILEWCRQMWIGKVQKLEECLREATSEKWFLAGQVQSLVQSINPMQRVIANLLLQRNATHADLQSSSGQSSPASSSLSSYGSSQNQSLHPHVKSPP